MFVTHQVELGNRQANVHKQLTTEFSKK